MLLGGRTNLTLMQAITAAGLTTNLRLVLDAGDAASYTSGTKWLDVSGNGYDFDLGAAGAAPTFTGAAGQRTAYWAFDGGDYFTYDTTNETWMQSLHQNNAIFTCVVMLLSSDFTPAPVWGTNGAASNANTGSNWLGRNASSLPDLNIANASADVLSKVGGSEISTGNWAFNAVSLNEATGAGGGFMYRNGSYNQVAGADTFDSTYSSPAAGNATYTMQIAALGNNNTPMSSGHRMSCIAFWTGTALSKANLDTLWALMRGRFGL